MIPSLAARPVSLFGAVHQAAQSASLLSAAFFHLRRVLINLFTMTGTSDTRVRHTRIVSEGRRYLTEPQYSAQGVIRDRHLKTHPALDWARFRRTSAAEGLQQVTEGGYLIHWGDEAAIHSDRESGAIPGLLDTSKILGS